MNGFEIIDLKKASFMDKVLRRQPRENAFVEINNLLACVPILKLDEESIENCLDKYKITHEKARSRLLDFYSVLLRYFVIDYDISKEEYTKLNHLQKIFSLESKEVNSVHRAITEPIYKRHVMNVVYDGILSSKEKKQLEELTVRLRIPKSSAKKIYTAEASKYLHSVLRASLEDKMLSDGEEKELNTIAKNLQVELKFTETAEQNLIRCRYLWNLYTGKLPKVSVNIFLDKDEQCSGYVNAKHYEISNVYHPVKYSGYHDSRGRYGREFQSGRIPTNQIAGKSMHLKDKGTLYFTNKRVLFNGTNGTKQFFLINLIGGSFYKNGMLLEQETGRDQFFEFRGDIEALRLIFNTLMTNSRK